MKSVIIRSSSGDDFLLKVRKDKKGVIVDSRADLPKLYITVINDDNTRTKVETQ